MSIEEPENGTLSLTTDGIKTIATITCVHGYSINGVSIHTCGQDGQWNPATSSCGLFFFA